MTFLPVIWAEINKSWHSTSHIPIYIKFLLPEVEKIFVFSAQDHIRPCWVQDTGHRHSSVTDLFLLHYRDKSEILQLLQSPFSPSCTRQPTHQNYHYLLVSSHCRLEKGNIDSCQGLNVFILIPPPSLLCQRQTARNTEHLSNCNSSHQDSILQEVEVTN